jgi:hypothetical protein
MFISCIASSFQTICERFLEEFGPTFGAQILQQLVTICETQNSVFDEVFCAIATIVRVHSQFSPQVFDKLKPSLLLGLSDFDSKHNFQSALNSLGTMLLIDAENHHLLQSNLTFCDQVIALLLRAIQVCPLDLFILDSRVFEVKVDHFIRREICY